MFGPDLRGVRLGGFELSEELGAGGFASVWRARQLRLDRDVAVKVLDPVVARDPDAARRFEREGRAAASLDHPNIVPVYEAGEDEGFVYLAMRLVDGETLEERLEREGTVSPAETRRILRPIAAALDHAHTTGLVHRDVKPSNVLLEVDGGVWLSDFGIAATTREMGRYTTGSIGTAEYMAPEQASGEEVDHRADIYALGCVAHHCMIGHPPYVGGDLLSTMMAHTAEPIPPTGDSDLDGFFAVALAKEPERRFESATSLIEALPVDADGAVTASPAGSGVRWGVVAGILSVIAVVAIVIAAIAAGSGEGDDVAGEDPTPAGQSGDRSADSDGGGDEAGTDTGTDESGPTPTPAPEGADGSLAEGGTVVVGSNLSLVSVNPHEDLSAEPYISGHVLPVLVTVGDDFTLTPSLATDIPEIVSTTPLSVRWRLRDDAVWDDGTSVTAADVEATWRYLTGDATTPTGTYFYDLMAGFEIVSDTEFTVTFSEPIGAWRLLFSTTHPIIKATALDAHLAGGGDPDSFMADGLDFSAGPYRVADFAPGERITLERNDAWWGDQPGLDRIEVVRYETSAEQLDAFASGKVDVASFALPAATDVVEARNFDDATVQVGPSGFQFEIAFNLAIAPFDTAEIRRAFAHALDRAAMTAVLVQPVTGEAAEPLHSVVFDPRHPAYEEPFAGYGDPGEAGRLLDDAGWLEGDDGFRSRDGEPLAVDVIYVATTVDIINAEGQAQTVRDQLRRSGIDATVTGLTRAEFQDRRAVGDWTVRLDFTVTNTDPTAAQLRFGSDFCPPTVDGCDGDPVGFNFGGYANADVDALLAAANLTGDTAARDELFARADELLAADVPVLPLYEGPAFVVAVDSLSGVDLGGPRGGPLTDLDEWAYLAGDS